jgi:hypothetical protein
VIKDLKFIEMGQGESKFFDNLLSSNWLTLDAITNNSVISYVDLGIVYSLIALAKKDRITLKQKVPWSAKL